MLTSFELNSEVTTTSLMRDDVYQRVREDILACNLVPGSLLQEKDLAFRYSVSKSPVRDALLRLQEQGLIEILPRKGYRILPVSLVDAEDLYDMRILLEKACIKRAIENATLDDLEGLERFRSASGCESLTQWVAYNRDFHRSIARLAYDIIDQFDRLTFMGVSKAPDDISAENLVSEHCQIINSIQSRDKTRAMRLINSHVLMSKKRLFAVLKNPPIVG